MAKTGSKDLFQSDEYLTVLIGSGSGMELPQILPRLRLCHYLEQTRSATTPSPAPVSSSLPVFHSRKSVSLVPNMCVYTVQTSVSRVFINPLHHICKADLIK